jgi:hypothetical protein
MIIEFVKAYRVDQTTVSVIYRIDGVEIKAQWHCMHTENGERTDYDLDVYVRSIDDDLASRVSESIKIGETDDNPDLELYLFIRDAFNSNNCGDI